MLDWLRSGPPGSAVEEVAVSDAPVDGDDEFRIRQTV